MISKDWIGIIDLLGAVHGLFLVGLLVGRRRNSVANRILAVAMAAFAIDLFSAFIYTRGLEVVYPHFIGIDFLLPFIYGPVIYLYARAVSEGPAFSVRKQGGHFVPLLAFALLLAPFYLQSAPEKIALTVSPESHPWTVHLTRLNHIKIVYALVYLLATFRLLRRHRERLKDTFSSHARINLLWLRNLLIGGLAMWGIALLFHLVWLQTTDAPGPVQGYSEYVSIAIAVFVYAIGYLGLRQPEIFTPDTIAVLGKEKSPVASDGPSYAKSGMGEAAAGELKARLIESMERDRLYRNSSLTLSDLARALSTSPHNLSEVINTRIGQNFHDFVNGYRVEEVKHRLADPSSDHLTLLAIAMDSGFNSKSSFNAVFKKHVQMTPSEYKKQLDLIL